MLLKTKLKKVDDSSIKHESLLLIKFLNPILDKITPYINPIYGLVPKTAKTQENHRQTDTQP